MPRVNCATAGTKYNLIAIPTDGLPNSEWVGSVTIQRDELASDNVTATTGYILICFPGRHNTNAANAQTAPTTALRDLVLSPAQPSVTIDLGTSGTSNSFIPLSQITITSTVNNEGVSFFTTEF